MKCQFATIEAMISLSAVGSAMALAYLMVNGYNNAYSNNVKSIDSNIAIYDFVQQINANKSLQACMSSSNQNAFGNCASTFIQAYQKTYRLSSISISTGNFTEGVIGNPSAKACIVSTQKTPQVCIIIS